MGSQYASLHTLYTSLAEFENHVLYMYGVESFSYTLSYVKGKIKYTYT